MLLRRPRDGALTRGWVAPAMTRSRASAHDIARFARGVDRTQPGGRRAAAARASTGRCASCGARPTAASRSATARRLTTLFAHGELVEVPDVSTFVPIDAPDAVATAIVGVAAPVSA